MYRFLLLPLYSYSSRPLPTPNTPRGFDRDPHIRQRTNTTRPALLLLVQHQAKHFETELRKLQTHGPELFFGFVTQDVGARGPECRDGLAQGGVVGGGEAVDVARVRDFAAGGGGGAVDLAVGQ